MSKTTKTILIVLGVIVLCCCLAGGGAMLAIRYGGEYIVDTFVIDDPAEIQQVADNLSDYSLPPGFDEAFGVNFILFQGVVAIDEYDGAMIMMFQFSESLYGGLEETRQQFQDSYMSQVQDNRITFTASEELPVVVNGQETTLYTYEGYDNDGYEWIQWMTVFDGKSGEVMLMIIGLEETWDNAEMEAFLQSIH